MKAWIITQEGTRTPVEVIGILSARKSAKIVKEYVEWLYALLQYSAGEHLNMARYSNPTIPYKVQFDRSNGVRVESRMTCGHNPWIEARFASNVSLIDTSLEGYYLEWTEPDKIIFDPNLHKIPGETVRFPVHLPLLITGQENALSV
jgi:hypothetical protein